jgi:hypothetical protein
MTCTGTLLLKKQETETKRRVLLKPCYVIFIVYFLFLASFWGRPEWSEKLGPDVKKSFITSGVDVYGTAADR